MNNPPMELVAGERRFRASKLAGLKTIMAVIRKLSDLETLEIQVMENEQREDVGPLEKAAGYRRLIDDHKVPIDKLAERLGKSVSTIRGLLHVLDLPEFAATALVEGRLPMSTASLISRVPGEQARKEFAIRVLMGSDGQWSQSVSEADLTEAGPDSEPWPPMSFREAKELLEQRFMLELKKAPFDRKSLTLLPSAGSCESCPRRAGNNPEYDGTRADVCTDPDCYRAKERAHTNLVKARAEKSGRMVLTAEQSKEIFSGSHLRGGGKFVDKEQLCHDDPKGRNYGELLGKQLAGETVLAEDERGGLHELLPRSSVEALLKKQFKIKDPNANFQKQQAADRKKQAARTAAAMAANAQVADSMTKLFGMAVGIPLDKGLPAMRGLVKQMVDSGWHDACHAVAKRRDLKDKDHRQAIKNECDRLTYIPALLALAAELVAARCSLDWSHTYFNGSVNGDGEFWSAFGVDANKLLKGANK